ncbi:hypothetical protein QU766_25375, partial [Escherichia coli]|nr:hypothetical protein [Escherichia coli]
SSRMTVAHNRWSAQRDCFLLSAEQPAGLSFSSPWFLDIARVMGELLMPSTDESPNDFGKNH